MKFTAIAAGAFSLIAFTSLTPATATATTIGNGTVGVVSLMNPKVDLSSSPATYTASFANTFETSGDGAFSAVAGLYGKMNGVLQFSTTRGTTIDETLSNFFVFDDGQNGTYSFSVSSVLTRNYADTPGVTTSIGLYLLGTTVDANLGYNDPTPTSLTLTFNSSGGSPYTASATLAVPPSPLDVPEPLSLALLGTGVLAAGIVRRVTTKA